MGAADYLAKPFDKDDLIARIQAIVCRTNGHSESIVRFGKVTINLDTRIVNIDDKRIHFTNKKYVILELLAIKKRNSYNKRNVLKPFI